MGQPTPTRRQALVIETTAPMAEEMPLVLAVELEAPAWAQHTIRFLKTRELPEEQEEAEKVARPSAMYQFVDNVLYKKDKWGEIEVHSPGGRTGVVGRDTWRHMWLPHRVEGPCRQGLPARFLLAHCPPGCNDTSNQV